MLRIIPLLLVAAFAAQPAQAGVTYTWQQVQASPSMPSSLNLELVFSDQAVNKGSLKLDLDSDCHYGAVCVDPQDSLLSLRYWYDDPYASGGRANLIDFRYRKQPSMFYDRIVLDLEFLSGGLLGGSILASNGESDFEMASAGSLFTMVRAGSDQWEGCGGMNPDCAGSTGLLALDAASDVPEPSTVALSGLGLLAAWFGRRRARQARA